MFIKYQSINQSIILMIQIRQFLPICNQFR